MKIKIKVPSDLGEITLYDYQRYMNVIENSNDELFIAQKTVSIFCGIPLQDTLQIAIHDIYDIVEHLKNVYNSKPSLQQRITFKGKDLGFIPKLDDISLGELIDVSNSINDVQKLHIAMGVLYRPIKAKFKDMYEIEEYKADEGIMEVMKSLPLDVVFGAMLFFYHLANDLLNHIPTYLETKVKEMSTHSKHSSEVSGDGITQSIDLLTEMLQDLTLLPSYLQHNV